MESSGRDDDFADKDDSSDVEDPPKNPELTYKSESFRYGIFLQNLFVISQ